MDRYDKDPKYRKMVDEALTGGPSQAATQYRKLQRLEDQPGYNPDNDPNLLRRIKHLTLIHDDNKLGPEFDKAIDQEDRELAKLGRDPKNILQRNNAIKTNPYPKQATPEQVEYLKKNLEKYKQTNGTKKPLTSAEKLNGDRKVRKYILNQIKNKTTVPEFKLDTEIPDAVKPEPVKQLTKQELLEEIQKHARENKVPVSPNDATGIFSSNEYFLRKRGI